MFQISWFRLQILQSAVFMYHGQYTGIPAITLLFGLFNIIYSFCPILQYWNGSKSADEKGYQQGLKKKPGPTRKLALFHEFILKLVRFRLGLVGFVLSDIFGIANSRVSQIFTTWITLLSNCFSKLIKWLSRNQVKKNMPESFCRLYRKTRVIIDCTEFFSKGQDLHLLSLILTVLINHEILENVYSEFPPQVHLLLFLMYMVVMSQTDILLNIQTFLN